MAQINRTKYAILGVLSIKPGSGYDIKKFCDASISHFWNENFGHIYPVLKQMEREGLVTKETERTAGRPGRNVFSITAQGRKELAAWLIQPVEYTPGRSELLLKLAFGKNVPLERTIAQIEQVKERNIRKLKEFRSYETALAEDPNSGSSEGYLYWLATLRYGIYSTEVTVRWCEETIQALRSQKISRTQDEAAEHGDARR
jgi:PadR family transcriptional regulator AphA